MIQANPTTAYPHSWLANKLNIPLELLEATLVVCKEQGRISENSTGIKILNFDLYQGREEGETNENQVPETPTNADKRPIEEEEEKEKESGKGIGIVEEEVGTATSTAETATKPSTEETHEDSRGVTETASETALLRFMETLEGWRFRRAEDLAWLREFLAEYPEFSLSFAKACRDYHSGRVKAKHKGTWKNRFREWMEHDRQFRKERSQASGADKRHTEPPKLENWANKPLRPATGNLGDWTKDKSLR
jgi:hypothetical protein